MTREGEAWVARVRVKPGLYHYGFLVDGEWHVPEHAPGKVADLRSLSPSGILWPRQRRYPSWSLLLEVRRRGASNSGLVNG